MFASKTMLGIAAAVGMMAGADAFSPSSIVPSSHARSCATSLATQGRGIVGSSFVGHRVALRAPAAPRAQSVTAPRMAVDVDVEDKPNSVKKLTIKVSADECQNAFQAVLTKLSKQAVIPGFRKGKAPAGLVMNHFGKESVTAEACEEIIGAAVPVALQMKDIKAIGQARMADEEQIAKMLKEFAPGNSVSFEVLVDVWPSPEITGSYTGMTIEAEKEEYEEDLVAAALNEMRKREATSILSSEDTVATVYPGKLTYDSPEKAEGAIAVVDLKGYRKNEDGSKGDPLPDVAVGENVEVGMESGKFFEGFVENLAGSKVGDTKTVPVTFPDNHKVPELRGSDALFDVTIKALKDAVYPPLDDEFATRLSDAKSMDDLKEKIRQQVSQEQMVSTDKNINKVLEEKIVGLIDMDVPETLVDEQTKTKFAQMMADFKAKGMDDEAVKSMITKDNFEKYKAKSRDNTVRALKVSFAVSEIAKKEGIKVDPTEVEGDMVALRQQSQGEEIDEESARNRIMAELERTKVLAFLKENNEVKLIKKKAAAAAEE